MENMEKQKFEDSLKKAFENAEVNPSENVWTNIELDLEKASGGHLKQRVVFFQMVAAACIIFALGVGVGILILRNDYEKKVNNLTALNNSSKTTEESSLKSVESNKTTAPNNTGETSSQEPKQFDGKNIARKENAYNLVERSSSKNNKNNKSEIYVSEVAQNESETASDEKIGISGNKYSNDKNAFVVTVGHEKLPSLTEKREYTLTFKKNESEIADPVALMLARLEQREKEVSGPDNKKDKEKSKKENLWTSVGFAAGSFNATGTSVTPKATNALLASNATIASKEAKASGTAYSVGLNVGTKISQRWVFQGGVNYLTQLSDYTMTNAVRSSDLTSFRPASIKELDKVNESVANSSTSDKLVSTAPYNVNNSSRYLSIPLQAGYLVVNRDFGVQLNAGVATDLFLQNTVKGEGNNLTSSTTGNGSTSPYRAVNLSGLFGTEFSYRFAQHYRIALNPGIRYPFNTIYKSDLGIQAMPLTFDVGLRFRYIFH
jgi:hypothetical protein